MASSKESAIPMKSAKIRCAVYLFLLAALCAVVNFHRLGERAFYGDEAIYAYVGKNMERSGDWLHFKSWYPNRPYLEKPPLYFWLTGLTRKLFSDEEFAYRFWSALFGVMCVLLTCLLGALLFSPEVGFLGALLLGLNTYFLLEHGARHGTMDTGVTLFGLAALVLVWFAPGWRRSGLAWLLAGMATGVSAMFKGMPVGLMFLVLALGFAFLYDGKVKPWYGIKASLSGVAGFLVVTLPWFIFQWVTYGGYIENQHIRRFTGNLHPDHVRGPFYYLDTVSHSSGPFILFLPALLLIGIISIRGEKKRRYGLLFIVGFGWLAAFSASISKLCWYMYPVFPLYALMIAAVLVPPAMYIIQRLSPPSVRPILPAAMGVAALLLMIPKISSLFNGRIPYDVGHYRDACWEVYQSPEWSRHPGARIVQVTDHDLERDLFRAYYTEQRMEGVIHVEDLQKMEQLLEGSGPLMVAVDQRLPDEYSLTVEKALADFEGVRIDSPWNRVYVRGLKPTLPAEMDVVVQPLGAHYMPLDQEIRFTTREVEMYLGPGWCRVEPDARWTVGHRAEVRLNLKQSTALILQIYMASFRDQRVIVELNGEVVETINAHSMFEKYTVHLPERLLGSENRLAFLLPDARSPKSLGDSEDTRVLGMRVISMRFEEVKS